MCVCGGGLGEDSWQKKEEGEKCRAVGDKAKERPAEFLECTGGLVGGVFVKGGFWVMKACVHTCICV